MFDQQHSSAQKVTAFETFEKELRSTSNICDDLNSGLIGKNAEIAGPFGTHKMVYADYVASGRALMQVEQFVLEHVLPYYANSHTESSFCGGYTTAMREEARRVILSKCNGNSADHAVIFSGSGATLALNKLVHLLGAKRDLDRGEKVTILVGPYEHHSNILPWRETGAQVIEIAEAEEGGPDQDHLRQVLETQTDLGSVIVSFSAASNVTGIGADVPAITKIVKTAGAKMVWDFAGGAPYLPIDLMPEDTAIDALVMSPHKFIGGPGASGVLIIRRDAVAADRPYFPGGGTVAFVNDRVHDYLSNIEEREEGGTPNIIGDIRAALVMIVKDALGQEFITRRNVELTQKTVDVWGNCPSIKLLGGSRSDRLPIFSFIVDLPDGSLFDFQSFTRDLSNRYGIQARGGCACAGPYVHRLLDISEELSDRLRLEILSGDESRKPGFVRLNLSVLMSDETVQFILESVKELADAYCSGDHLKIAS
ncbi:MAG: aminotransferase class V-fold PLP-dependent enzyme [Paracoccaceae bacterium]|nr:aminotransferase class V-fold PLP-dependent enzyme [Paracoccaceae bacterium]MDG2259775.1 aminotransferase class V-fold PLP-dependent enzyme [Paracoccaceae bacterium]